jgi:hypothetical protein
VTLARFLPIIRTFAPFVAGVAKMPYPRFFGFSVGTVFWVGGLVTLGYFFGNVPFIKKNLSLLVVGIILLSLVPMIIGVFRSRFGRAPPKPSRRTCDVVPQRLASPAPSGQAPDCRRHLATGAPPPDLSRRHQRRRRPVAA